MTAEREDLAAVRAVEVTRVSRGGVVRGIDAAASEAPLDIRLHGRSFAVIMRTPGDDRSLAAGFLLSERIVRSGADLAAVEHCRHPDRGEAHHVVEVFLAGALASRVTAMLEARRQFVASSACGVCGRATIDELRRDIVPLVVDARLDLALLRSLPSRLREAQPGFEETGGLHGAAIFAGDGRLLSAAEDVGRHNAVDKAVGQLLLSDRVAPASAVLAVSGRVAFEIVQKAWLGGISTIIAVSAPTTLAIELADEAGITLIGFARGDNLNIYSHASRVAGV